MNKKGKTQAGSSSTIALAILATVVVVAIAFGGLYYFGYVNVGPASVTNPHITSTGPSGSATSSNPMVNVNRPIPFVTTNGLNGSLVVSTTITILTPSGTTLETLTSDGTTAKVSSSNTYPSGTQLIIEVAKTGYVTQEFSFVVPQMLQSDTYGTTSNYQVNVPVYGYGSFSMVVTDSMGNVYTNASTTYNWTAHGTTSDTFTVTLYSTQNYEGWRDSHDVVNNVDWNLLVAATDSSTHLSINGAQNTVNWGSTISWIWQVPQDNTLRLVQGNTVQKAGISSFTFTVNKGSESGAEHISFLLWNYGSVSQFSQTGAYGPNAGQPLQFQLDFTT